MKEVKIIALSGYIGSGKDYIAKLLESQYGYLHLKLAGLIKLNYCLIHGITLEQLEERKYKDKARPYLIELGEKMKEVDQFIHCNYVYHQILFHLPKRTKIVVSDFRFPYEDLYFRKFDRCSKGYCDINTQVIFGGNVKFTSLYIESDLADKSSTKESESYYDKYFKPNSNGIIVNNQDQRYDRNNQSLIHQLTKFI